MMILGFVYFFMIHQYKGYFSKKGTLFAEVNQYVFCE